MTKTFFTVLLSFAVVSACAGSWQWVDPRPQGNALASAARSSAGTLVAMGAYGTCLRREAGQSTWTSVSLPGIGADDLTDVVFLQGKFLAIGPEAGLWTSADDGRAWLPENPDLKGRYLFSLSDRLVVLNGLTSVVSVNGGPFQTIDLADQGIRGYRTAAAAVGTVVVAGNAGMVATTSNGREWDVATLGGADHIFYALASGPSGFLLGGVKPSADGRFYEPVLFESQDGASWSPAAAPAGTGVVYDILPAPDGWFFQNSGDGRIFRRDAAGAWTALTGEGMENFAMAASLRVSALSGDAVLFDERGLIATVDAGAAATLLDAPLRPSGFLVPPAFTAAAVGDLVLALDRNAPTPAQNALLRTTDGINWTEVSPPPVGSLTALAAAGSEILGFSAGDRVTEAGLYRTADGSVWELVARATDADTGAAIFSGDVISLASRADQSALVALTRRESYDLADRYRAERGLYFSADRVNWTPVALPELREDPPPFAEVPESVQWDGERFILLVHPGRIYTSEDGRAWTRLAALPDDSKTRLQAYGTPLPPARNLAISVASNGSGLLVARAAKYVEGSESYVSRASNTPEIFYLYRDGRWWPQPVSDETAPILRRIIWDGAQFIATSRREILTSTDGLSWQTQPAPARLLSLVSSGVRLFGFSDSFGVLRYDGRLPAGQPVESFSLSPGSSTMARDGGSYRLVLQLPEGTAWRVIGRPSWMSITPASGTGSAELEIFVRPNSSSAPRGAVLEIAGLPHYLHQAGRREPAALTAPWSGSTLTVPFAGAWRLAADPRLALASSPAGNGPVRFRVPSNEEAAPRTIVFDINGTSYSLTQEGAPPELSRAGQYDGVLGSLPAGLPFDPRNMETFEGSVRFNVTRPRGEDASGAFSARLQVYVGGRLVVFSGSGALDAEGRAPELRWTSLGADARQITINFQVNDTGPYGRSVTGRFAFSDAPNDVYSFMAGKQVFHRSRHPLPSHQAGPATFFLGSFGSAGASAEAGVGTLRLTAGGTARLAVTMADGGKATAAGAVWGATTADLVLPFAYSLRGGSSFAAGYLLANSTADQFDWDGIGAWNNYPAGDVTFLSAFMSRYTPPPFEWSGPAAFSYAANDDAFSGAVELRGGARLAVTAGAGQDETAPRVKLQLDPRNGLVRGTAQRPGSAPVRLVGAVNPKIYGFTRDRGAVLGLVIGSSLGTFNITPVSPGIDLP